MKKYICFFSQSTPFSGIKDSLYRFRNTLPLTHLYPSVLLLLVCFISAPHSYAQESKSDSTSLRESAVRIFLDVSRIYQDHIKREITFVNYVRDRKQAQVYVMMTMQRTGAGGMEYTIALIGQQNFVGVSDTLKYVSKQSDTQNMTRSGIVRILKMGLIPYVSKTPLADYISINYKLRRAAAEVVDKWNYWVFNTGLSSYLNGEELRKSYSINVSLSADRVTPHWKTSFGINSNYSFNKYNTDDGIISSTRRYNSFQGLIVKSLNGYWSAGGYLSVKSSIYNNTKFGTTIAPAIEFNVFPYAQSTRREFRFLYKVGGTNIHYNEETVYNKLQENLINESLSATYEIKERWGSIQSTLEGFHYFHDFRKMHLQLRSNLNIRIFEGLSLNLRGNISWIRDQLSLPREDATDEEILLRQQQLATQYDYYMTVGFRYKFGSIY